MISQYTWPNFRAGSEMDGVKVLMKEKNFMNDVKFGRTKIFIRSPKTLFALEKQRNDMIPHIVTLLQKQVRGWICRQQYKKMKAAITIMRCYRLVSITYLFNYKYSYNFVFIPENSNCKIMLMNCRIVLRMLEKQGIMAKVLLGPCPRKWEELQKSI